MRVSYSPPIPGPALRYWFVMPIDDLQQAAQKIAGFLATLNKLGGLRLKYRISAGNGADGGAQDAGSQSPALCVELAGPDVPLVTQHNGELLLALETIAAQILRLDQREGDLVSFDAANFKALRAAELRLTAETTAEKVLRSGIPLRLSAHEQPRAPSAAHGLPRHRRRGDGQLRRRHGALPRRLSGGQNPPARRPAPQAARLWRSRTKLRRSWPPPALARIEFVKSQVLESRPCAPVLFGATPRPCNYIETMRTKTLLLLLFLSATLCPAQKRLVLIDQDGAGPGGSDQMAMLALLQAPQVEVLGITMVTGDAWRDEETLHTLRMLELTGHANIPVARGAVFPLVRTQEETRLSAALNGKVEWLGAWGQSLSTEQIPAFPAHR